MTRTNMMLMGVICSGKTYSLRTLLKEYPDAHGKFQKGAGKTALVVALEPGVADSLADCRCELGLHIHTITPLSLDWDDLTAITEQVSRLTGEALVKMTDPRKRDYTQFLDVYSCLRHYVCERCGADFGPVDKLDDSFAVAMDGLTGLSKMAMHITAGLKPTKSWPEYDAAGQLVENLLMKCCGDLKASFILLTHVDREPDAVLGSRLTVHTIGNKLAPRLTKDLFSEIACARRDDTRDGPRFYWSTVETNFDLKARRLPFSDTIPPDFTQLLGG